MGKEAERRWLTVEKWLAFFIAKLTSVLNKQ
jgi:hypothetical protein